MVQVCTAHMGRAALAAFRRRPNFPSRGLHRIISGAQQPRQGKAKDPFVVIRVVVAGFAWSYLLFSLWYYTVAIDGFGLFRAERKKDVVVIETELTYNDDVP